MEYVSSELNKGNDVDGFFGDFSKAFDKVPHNGVTDSLSSCRIIGGLNNWIGNWLDCRMQRVVLNGNMSEWVKVTSGVPQGAVLGPLLFILVINDLEKRLNCKVLKFADDTKLLKSIGGIHDNISQQKNIDKLMGWAYEKGMEFNTAKCKTIHFGKPENNFNYNMGAEWVDNVDQSKDLGVVIDNKLKFSKQALLSRNKANKMVGFMKHNVMYKSKEVVTSLTNAYVRPHLEYCQQACGHVNKGDMNMLEAVQRRATKLIPSINKLPYEQRLTELNLFSMERRFIRGDLIQVFKIVNKLDNLDFNTFFTYNLRSSRGHNKQFKKQSFRTNIRKFTFSQRVVDAWNALPQEAIDSESLNVFKSRLDKFTDTLIREDSRKKNLFLHIHQ